MKKKSDTADKFSEWIEDSGTINVAIKLGKHQATVEAWKHRRTLPTACTMTRLIKEGAGKFDYADIIEPFYVANPHLDN